MAHYQLNAHYQALPQREQEIIAYHDVLHPLNAHEQAEETLDMWLWQNYVMHSIVLLQTETTGRAGAINCRDTCVQL